METQLTTNQVAEMFGVTPCAVYKWVKAGLPHKWVKVAGKRSFRVFNPREIVEHRGFTHAPKEIGQ